MKKVILSLIAVAGLSACSHDYSDNRVRYTQWSDGDCVVSTEQSSGWYSDLADSSSKTVYRNTQCAKIYRGAAQHVSAPVVREHSIGCGYSSCNVNRARYVLVQAD
ncbi:MAG: hypothetical protein LBO08_01915 [Rickettsiales bacterium]|jgi:hypothetical protein|nr:hypothetical protein [Rickettsiales bacterium]